MMDILNKFGWKNYCSKINDQEKPEKPVGRVVSVKGNIFEITTEKGILKAELLGKLLFACEKWEQPKVGDWVCYLDYGDTALISEVLPRYNQLYRKAVGKDSGKQVIAANVDNGIIVQGLDNDFNINRIERYIVQITHCNIKPILILNKTDLVNDVDGYIKEVERLQRNLPLYCCSVASGKGIKEIQERLFVPGATSVMIGSSGVGKSSLVNALSDSNSKTSEISVSTGKGKHTTTTRDLFLLDNGSIIIDTPGMREFGLAHEDGQRMTEAFPAIEKWAVGCKFKDCTHTHEEGCKVMEALKNGDLNHIIYDNYLKLIKEQKRYMASTQEKNKQGKQFGKIVKEAKQYRKKYKW